MKKILTFLSSFALLFAPFAFAVASSYPVGGETYYLAGAGITSTANTITLTSFTTPDGVAITMSNFGTVGYGALEPQSSSKIEDISFTGVTQNANGTATLTGVTRGVQFIYPYASSVSLEKAHSGGAQFIITNTPEFYYNEFAMQNLSNVTTWPSASTSPATKGYVDFVAFNGAGVINADTSNRGVVQIATQTQVASSTALGSTGATIVIPASAATSTYNAATAALRVITTQNNGTFDSNFLPASTTKALTFASSTYFGSTYSFDIGKHEQVFTASSTFTVPPGVHTVFVRMVGGGGQGGAVSSACNSGGGAGGYAEGMIDVSATTSVQVIVGATAPTSATTTSSFGYPTLGIMATVGSAGSTAGNNAGIAGGVGGLGIGGSFDSQGATGQGCLGPSTGQALGYASGGWSVLGYYGSGGQASGNGQPGAVIVDY